MFHVNGGFPKLSKNNALYKNAVFHVAYQFHKWTSSALVLLNILHIFILKLPAAGTDLKTTGLLTATAKFAVENTLRS